MSTRPALPNRRNHTTQKVRIGHQRTLNVNVYYDAQPTKILLRLKDSDCSAELVGLYYVVTRLMRIALQYFGLAKQLNDL
jgi:hypothetical protein